MGLLDREAYNGFEVHPWFMLLKKKLPDKYTTIKRGLLLTPFGRSFTRGCIPDGFIDNTRYIVDKFKMIYRNSLCDLTSSTLYICFEKIINKDIKNVER